MKERRFLEDDEIDIIIGQKNKNRIRFFQKLTKKIMSPITKVIDGVETDYSERSRGRRALISVFKLKKQIIILIVLAVVMAGVFFAWRSSRVATAEMSLNYEESAYGLNPNATRLNIYEISSPEVVEKMLYYCGIDIETVDIDEIIDCISVKPINAKDFSEKDLFISTTYRIKMKMPESVKGVSVQTMVDFLCKAYKDNLYSNYTENRSILEFDIEELNDKEYMVIADLLDLKAQQIVKYLTNRVKQSKTFTEKESEETFKSLMQKAEDLQDYVISKYRAFVMESGCSFDKIRYIRSLQYTNRIKTLTYDKNIAAYDVNNDGIKMYNEMIINVVMIPSIDRAKNTYYMSRTKTGMDYMAKSADNHLNTAEETGKEVIYNEEVIAKMASGTNSKVDIPKADNMIEEIHRKLADLSKQVETVDKAYVKYKTKDYLTFKPAVTSIIQMLQPVKLLVLAVALLCAIYALIWLRSMYLNKGGSKK